MAATVPGAAGVVNRSGVMAGLRVVSGSASLAMQRQQ